MKVKNTAFVDVIRYQIKAKNLEDFNENCAEEVMKLGKYTVFENPSLNCLYEESEKLIYRDWAAINLKEVKKIEVDEFYKSEADEILNYYVILSPRAIKKYEKKFLSLLALPRSLADEIKCLKKASKFSKSVGNVDRHDVNYNDAEDLIYLSEKNKCDKNNFQKFLKKLNILSAYVEPE